LNKWKVGDLCFAPRIITTKKLMEAHAMHVEELSVYIKL